MTPPALMSVELAALLDRIRRSRPAWMVDAACIGSPVDFTSKHRRQRAAALQICGGCPVVFDCRDWSLTIDDDVSVLGGLDPAARRQHLQRRAKA